MAFSTDFITALALLMFNNTNIANFGDATGVRGSSAAGNLYLSLHTANPGVGGKQNTSEAAYTGYGRVAVPRTSATPGWSCSAGVATLTQTATFGSPTSGPETEQYGGLGFLSSGAGTLIGSAILSANINVTNGGAAPTLTTATTFTLT
jgi:hypothetical protein